MPPDCANDGPIMLGDDERTILPLPVVEFPRSVIVPVAAGTVTI